MVMDRTEEFRKVANSSRKTGKNHPILKKTKQTSDFENKAKKILHTIGQLKLFLEKNRRAYMNSQDIFNGMVQMSDQEKDEIETSAEEIIKNCSETIKKLNTQVNQSSTKHIDAHRRLVIEILQKYLKFVCKIYSEQRAIRVKQVVDKKLISRLHHPKLLGANSEDKTTENTTQPINNSNKQSDFSFDEYDGDISENEEAQFAQENVQLMQEFNSMVDEVKSIEGRVVEIARLQEVFAEQVLQQDHDIDIVADKVAESTENIKDGNEEIREAIKNNAGFRVWILFFIVMCSLSLLILEWYS